ncbi:hypothetical protein FACS1894218_2480 [Bacilli bacterium]|nr:hypothetical protein FACS1894218_2480 [Bacilli bacterium]
MRSIMSRIVEESFKTIQKKKLTSEKNIIHYIEHHSSYKPPKIYFSSFDIKYTRVNGFPCYKLKPRGKVTNKKIIYIHGGAFILEMTVFH